MKLNFKILKCLLILTVFLLLSCRSKPTEVLAIECGGSAQFGCPKDSFCNLNINCGGVDHKGVCKKIPHNCDNNSEPVCGCNNKTYTNTCLANASKISVDHPGSCIDTN